MDLLETPFPTQEQTSLFRVPGKSAWSADNAAIDVVKIFLSVALALC